jgi:uncharacterized delta-60 repeat protein
MKKVFTLLTFLVSTQLVFAQTSGTLDNTFGSFGRIVASISPNNDMMQRILIQNDGKILVSGTTESLPDYTMEIARLNTNGKLDSTFGINGKVILTFGATSSFLYSMALQADGKIVVGGFIVTNATTSDYDFALARLNTDGSLDTSFGSLGKLTMTLGSGRDQIRDMTVQADGKILVVGETYQGTDISIVAVRYTVNGSLDTSFNRTGKLITHLETNIKDGAWGVVIQRDSKSVIGINRYYGGGSYGGALIRYNTNGMVDMSFGINGSVKLSDAYVSHKILSNGQIVVACNTNPKSDYILYRYNENGSLDSTFGYRGQVITLITPTPSSIFDMVVQEDEKIILCGGFVGWPDVNPLSCRMFRYTVNGALDNTFGTNGEVTTIPIELNEKHYRMALQRDGKIVVLGNSSMGLKSNFNLMRYHNTVKVLTKNDTCQNAITLTPSVFFNGTTANATAEANPNRVLSCETNQNVKDVWYKFRSDTGALRPFRMQLTLTQLTNSTAFKYAVYAGSCSDFILRGSCKTVVLNGTVIDTLVLSEANQDYYIRVWASDTAQSASFSIKIQGIQNFNTVPIAQATTVAACQPFTSVNISTANSQKWSSLMDGNNIVAEINPNGNLLGQVMGGYFINSTGTIRRASGTPYLDRNIGIKVTNQPTTNVSVRLYFTERERAAYFAIVGANPLAITHYAGALCLATVQTGSGDLLPATIRSTPSGDYYVEFNTTRFSGFFLGPNRSLVFSHEVNVEPTKLMIQEVYPTPVLTDLGVVFTAHQATSKGRIFVTDILGKTVLMNIINIESGRNELKLNTSAFATGLYILHISDGVYETAKKIIKQ